MSYIPEFWPSKSYVGVKNSNISPFYSTVAQINAFKVAEIGQFIGSELCRHSFGFSRMVVHGIITLIFDTQQPQGGGVPP